MFASVQQDPATITAAIAWITISHKRADHNYVCSTHTMCIKTKFSEVLTHCIPHSTVFNHILRIMIEGLCTTWFHSRVVFVDCKHLRAFCIAADSNWIIMIKYVVAEPTIWKCRILAHECMNRYESIFGTVNSSVQSKSKRPQLIIGLRCCNCWENPSS